MIEKIGPIKNPLTIIAIFAGISEISGTAVLPLIANDLQASFIWFVMLFPVFLVGAFFVTLNFNRRALYAPSDFGDEDNFFRDFTTSNQADRKERALQEIAEAEETQNVSSVPGEQPMTELLLTDRGLPEDKPQLGLKETSIIRNYSKLLLTEDLVLTHIANEFKQPVRKNVSFGGDRKLVFDGIIEDNDKIYLIDVKFSGTSKSILSRLSKNVDNLVHAYCRLPKEVQSKSTFILAYGCEITNGELQIILPRVEEAMLKVPFPIKVRLFSLRDLQMEYILS